MESLTVVVFFSTEIHREREGDGVEWDEVGGYGMPVTTLSVSRAWLVLLFVFSRYSVVLLGEVRSRTDEGLRTDCCPDRASALICIFLFLRFDFVYIHMCVRSNKA